MAELALVADDLSGAVESAATLLSRTSRIRVFLDPSGPAASDQDHEVLAIDTDSRQLPARAAAAKTTAAFVAVAGSRVVFKKIDSLLRGNLEAELRAARELRPHLVIAPALPTARRTLRRGIVHVDGQALHESDAWRAETLSPPASVAIALSSIPTRTLPLSLVRSPQLAEVIRETLSAGMVPICDGETDVDLDCVVAATAGIEKLVLVGSAGLAAALASSVHTGSRASDPPSPRSAQRVLVGIGSAAPGIPAQIAALREMEIDLVLVRPAALGGSNPDCSADLRQEIRQATRPVVVVAVDPDAAVDAARSRDIARAFAAALADVAPDFDGIVLTGGETARAVLDRCGITELRPLFQVHHGAVVCVASDGHLIATRPGSFGDRDSLLSIVRALQAGATPTEEFS